MVERVQVCAICGAEFITKAPHSKYCSAACKKVAHKQAHDKWYTAHRDEILANRRQWWANNLERARGWTRKYYVSHREICLKRIKVWRDANKDELNARNRATRAAHRAKHGYKTRTCPRCGADFKPLYGVQRLCNLCMTKRSPTWRRKLQFLTPQIAPTENASALKEKLTPACVAPKPELIPDERGMLYCSRLRLKSTELPCGQLEVCFGKNACEYLPEGAVRPKGTLI